MADEKLYNLCNNEVTRNLQAVQNRRFITIPFSATTLGVRIGSLALNLAEAVTALVQTTPLSAVSFTETSLADDSAKEALGASGAIVYTRLPIVNNVDLETFCPGGETKIFVALDDAPDEPATPTTTVEEDTDVSADEPIAVPSADDEDAAATAAAEESTANHLGAGGVTSMMMMVIVGVMMMVM